MRLPLTSVIALLLLVHSVLAQVSYISGSYLVATATGSGGGGIPSLTYTASAGTDRLLLFFMAVERDHNPGGNGDNWASNAPTGGSVPSVELDGTSLAHLNSQWYYDFQTTDVETDAEISIELMVFGMLEANIPSGSNTFTITGNYNSPTNAGDEAVFGAIMFENVDGISHIVDANCTACDTINTSNVSPDDGNNAVFSLAVASSDRTYTYGDGYTGHGNSSVANASGNYTDNSERDGISLAAQSVSGTIDNQQSPIGISGSADVFGMMLSSYRITSPTLLPVELIDFKLIEQGNNRMLSWSTATETNNNHFVVEFSEKGFHWEALDSIDGYGNSYVKRDYVFENTNLLPGYYRLKQVDYNGDFEYSRAVLLQPVHSDPIRIHYSAFQDGINIESKEDILSLKIIDLNGQVVYEENVNHQTTYFVSNHEIGDSGGYILLIQTEYSTISKKVILVQ